jgi:hypothetical protein
MEYQPTLQEIKEFQRDRMGYARPISSSYKKEKQSNGQLVLIEGNNVTVIKYDAPWALLQSIKAEYIRKGYKKSNLFLKSLLWKR